MLGFPIHDSYGLRLLGFQLLGFYYRTTGASGNRSKRNQRHQSRSRSLPFWQNPTHSFEQQALSQTNTTSRRQDKPKVSSGTSA